MPQGDLTFFPHDAGLVLGGYLGGYLVFAAVVAPRLVALYRARQFLSSPHFGATRVGRAVPAPAGWAALLAVAPPVPEALLAWVQFGALALGVYLATPTAPRAVALGAVLPGRALAPSFEATARVVVNLIHLWDYHRGSLFVGPTLWALTGTTTRVLHRLARPARPRLLPRLLGAVHASRGLGG